MNVGERRISQIPSGGDRTRTYWTPPMDRYLVDLLLDQVHRGNKLGQTFIAQAWVDMVILFNTKFGSNHDKDVLKNRYKHLRRQYNDIKFLLEQSGFSWNEARDMVTAEDSVWDAYIKERPDARSYRVKTVPSYHKLGIIFGEDIYDGRYTHLALNLEVNDETPVLMTGTEKNDHLNSSINPPRIEWTLPMDRYLIDLMLQHTHRGSKISQTFTEQAWADMVVSFNEKFTVQSDIYILENRYICLMKEHDDINNLLSHVGFFWDESKQMVTAEEVVWEAYIKEHPDFILYRDKFLGNYNDLSKIFASEVPDGRVNYEAVGMEMEKKDELEAMDIDGVSGDLACQAAHIELCEQRRKRPALTPSSSEPLNKASKTGQMQKSLSEMAGAVTTWVNKKENKNYVTIESAVGALQAIPDIDDELLLDACDLLEDERKAKTFLALDVTLRKKWLLRKLRL